MDAQTWNERYAAADLVWSQGPNQFLVEHAQDLTPGSALDLACGEGRNAIWLAARGWSVTGVDFSSVAIEKAARIAAARDVTVELEVRDLTQWAPPVRAFDLVIVFYLQLGTGARAAVWRAAAGAVASGGTLLVVGHDRRNLDDGYGGPQSADVLYTADEITACVGELEVEQAGEVIRRVTLETGEQAEAIDCLVLARRR